MGGSHLLEWWLTFAGQMVQNTPDYSTGKDKLIDYYIEQPGQDRIYAFSKTFTQNTYDMCKSGIRVNELSTKRSRDRGVMRLVNYLNVVLPYLSDYYELPVVA